MAKLKAKFIKRGRTHLVIPDTQIRPGHPTRHLMWIAAYIRDYQPDVIVHLGDHWDMASLSSYDKGKKDFEGRRYLADIEAGNQAFEILDAGIAELNHGKRAASHYTPERHFLLGNHENRIARAVDADAVLDGVIGFHDLGVNDADWQVHGFLEPVCIDGITYSHYFYNPYSGRAWGGQIITRLKNIGFTFTMGHQQGKDQAERHLADGTVQRGLVVGSCYLHDEDYKGPQANFHWRGIIVKHECRDGNYDLMEVSLDYLCRRYEGMTLADWIRKNNLTELCGGAMHG